MDIPLHENSWTKLTKDDACGTARPPFQINISPSSLFPFIPFDFLTSFWTMTLEKMCIMFRILFLKSISFYMKVKLVGAVRDRHGSRHGLSTFLFPQMATLIYRGHKVRNQIEALLFTPLICEDAETFLSLPSCIFFRSLDTAGCLEFIMAVR